MQISKLDHLVLTVRDIETTCNFYADVLGCSVVTFSGTRKALVVGDQKINLHEFGKEHHPHAKYPSPGSADLCFLTDLHVKQIVEQLAEKRVMIIEGPVQRSGAKGPIISIYIKDPDGNLIEIANPISNSTRDQDHAA